MSLPAVATDYIALQEIIRERARRVREDNLFWSRFTGHVQMMDTLLDNGQHKYKSLPSGQVVEKQDFIIEDSRDTVMIPSIEELKQYPTYGDAYLSGTGETVEFKFMKAFINQVSGVIKVKDGNMSDLRDKGSLKSYHYNMSLLNNWFAKVDNAHIIGALYEQHSKNVLAGLNEANNGIGVTGHYHPNMYYNKVATDGTSGAITVVGTEKRNKTAAQITAAAHTDYAAMTYSSSYMLDALVEKAQDLHIQPVLTWQDSNGNSVPMWILVVDLKIFNRLRRDTTIKDNLIAAWTSSAKWNIPLFMNNFFAYNQCLIMIDTLTPRHWNNDTQNFIGTGAHYYERPDNTTSEDNSVINLLGASALGWAIPAGVGDAHFEDEVTNFKQNEERAGLSINGVCRADFVEEDRVATYFAKKNATETIGGAETKDVLNQSSMQLIVKV